MNISFREIKKGDRALLLNLYRSTNTDIEKFGFSISGEQKKSLIEMQFSLQDNEYKRLYPDAQYLIIHHADKDIGRLYIKEKKDSMLLIDITLDPAFRSIGIGSQILTDIINDAKQKGKPVVLHVAKGNPARRLYERLNFKEIEERGMYHLMINDHSKNEILEASDCLQNITNY